jgi:phage-related protein
MPDSVQCPSLAGICHELRIKIATMMQFGELYTIITSECIVILHAFMKKTEKTPQTVIDLSKKDFPCFTKDIED